MKVIVAGGRDFTDMVYMDSCIKQLVMDGSIADNSELVCGMARGADITGYNLWHYHYKLPIHKFYADWKSEPRRAGFIRNEDMGDVADVLVAFWDGESRGTKHMIDYMTKLGKPVFIFRY